MLKRLKNLIATKPKVTTAVVLTGLAGSVAAAVKLKKPKVETDNTESLDEIDNAVTTKQVVSNNARFERQCAIDAYYNAQDADSKNDNMCSNYWFALARGHERNHSDHDKYWEKFKEEMKKAGIDEKTARKKCNKYY